MARTGDDDHGVTARPRRVGRGIAIGGLVLAALAGVAWLLTAIGLEQGWDAVTGPVNWGFGLALSAVLPVVAVLGVVLAIVGWLMFGARSRG